MPLHGDPIATGQASGRFIGDHTRTGIGSMLNSGTSIGVMCNVLPAGPLLPKHVPSFAAVLHGRVRLGSRWRRCSPRRRSSKAAAAKRSHRERSNSTATYRANAAGTRAHLPASAREPQQPLAFHEARSPLDRWAEFADGVAELIH